MTNGKVEVTCVTLYLGARIRKSTSPFVSTYSHSIQERWCVLFRTPKNGNICWHVKWIKCTYLQESIYNASRTLARGGNGVEFRAGESFLGEWKDTHWLTTELTHLIESPYYGFVQHLSDIVRCGRIISCCIQHLNNLHTTQQV